MTPIQIVVALAIQGDFKKAAGALSTIHPFDKYHPQDADDFLSEFLSAWYHAHSTGFPS